jgi:phosphoglycolate phosphatase-like HAD superfamily hydrolase
MDGLEVLPSWNDGPAKAAILDFVRSVTMPGDGFVPPPDRIVTFDNDGTLWCEKPLYAQADFVFRRFREMVREDPRRAEEQPYKAVVEDDREWLMDVYGHVPELIKGVTEAFGGLTTEAFDAAAREFFASASHPTLGRPYTEVAYRPMLELIDLLRTSGFEVYICSGGGRDFVRAVCEQVYGLSRDRVIGSATALEYRDGDLYRTAGVEQPIDDGPGKPVHIWARTGRKPLFAAGNSDGDVAMLECARFALLLDHDDDAREFAYDEGAERAMAAAAARGWTVVSMKEDFSRVF